MKEDCQIHKCLRVILLECPEMPQVTTAIMTEGGRVQCD